MWDRNQMAERAGRELQDGWYVNLGIGIPTLVANYIPAGINVTLQSENGMLGMGPFPFEGEEDPDLINAGKQTITELPRHVHKKGDHQSGFDGKPLLAAALQGHDVGLVSEAGMPAVADPGSSVVRAAHDLGLTVVPLVGPVSLLLALAASGLNGQNFAFVGYLPQDAAERAARLKQLESLALKTGQTQMWIETPYRNAAMLSGLLQSLQGGTRLAIASGLTLPSARIQSHTVAQWKKGLQGPDGHTPAVYAIGP